MRKIANTATWALFLVMVAVAAGVLYSTLHPNGSLKFLSVVTGSMNPAVKKGSLIVIQPQNEYFVNDIVTFASKVPGRVTLTHRIVGVEFGPDGSKTFLTKGDANQERDSEKLQPEQIFGSVVYYVPYAGYLINFSKTIPGLVTFVILPSLIVVVLQIKSIKNEMTTLRKQKINHRGVSK